MPNYFTPGWPEVEQEFWSADEDFNNPGFVRWPFEDDYQGMTVSEVARIVPNYVDEIHDRLLGGSPPDTGRTIDAATGRTAGSEVSGLFVNLICAIEDARDKG